MLCGVENAICRAQELAQLPPCAGTVVVRLRVAGASGAVQALEWLTDTLVPLPAAEYSAADARGDVFEAIMRRLGGARFPTCAEGARRTRPKTFLAILSEYAAKKLCWPLLLSRLVAWCPEWPHAVLDQKLCASCPPGQSPINRHVPCLRCRGGFHIFLGYSHAANLTRATVARRRL